MKPMRLYIEQPEGLRPTLKRLHSVLIEVIQGGAVEVIVRRPTRTLLQNRKLWPMLSDLSKQVNWYGYTLTNTEWKIVLSASLKKQKIVPAIDGGFVSLGTSTRALSKQDFSDLIELTYAFGAEQNVQWGGKALSHYETYRQAA